MGDRIGNCGQWRHNRNLADATNAEWMARCRHFNNASLDQREVEAGRHSVIKQAAVTQNALVVVKVLLVQRPADPMGSATLHLTFDVARMNRFANVLRHRGAQNFNLARVGIDFHVDEGSSEGWPNASCINRGAAGDRSTSTGQTPG